MFGTVQAKYEKKYFTEIGPLIKETMNDSHWELKQQKIQQDFLWALGPEATHEKTRSEY